MSTGNVAPRGVLMQTVRTANAVRSHLERAVLREVRLSWSAFDVLTLARQRHITGSGPLEFREAAQVVGIAKSTLTVAVQTLIDRQLLRRELDSDDRRRALLRPTASGLMVAERLLQAVDAEQQRLLAELPLPGQDLVTVLLRTLAGRCETSAAAQLTGRGGVSR